MCGSDLKFYRANSGPSSLGLGGDDKPVIAGHEPCGVIVEIGSNVPKNLVSKGMRFMQHHYQGCGTCSHCSTGWQQLCVDLIGPYQIPINSSNKAWKKKTFDELWCLTMIDPATSWFEVVEIFNKTPMEIANIVEMTWLNRYPRPGIITFDGGSKFKAEFKKVMRDKFNQKVKAI